MKMLHIPFLSLLVTGLTFVNVQGEAVHIKSALQSSDPSGPKCLAVNSFADGAPVEMLVYFASLLTTTITYGD